MKTFKDLREASKPKGEVVYSAKTKGSIKVNVSISKTSKGYLALVDGDTLDTFKSQSDAMKALKTTVKELGGTL